LTSASPPGWLLLTPFKDRLMNRSLGGLLLIGTLVLAGCEGTPGGPSATAGPSAPSTSAADGDTGSTSSPKIPKNAKKKLKNAPAPSAA